MALDLVVLDSRPHKDTGTNVLIRGGSNLNSMYRCVSDKYGTGLLLAPMLEGSFFLRGYVELSYKER